MQTLVEKVMTMTKPINLNSIFRNILLSSCCLFIGVAGAQQKFIRAQATEAKKEDALAKAKVAAWKNYLGTLQGSKLDNLLANEKLFLSEIDSFVVDINVIDEKCATQPPSCTVSIKATVNESIIDSRLRKVAQDAGGGKVSKQEDVAFLVTARVAEKSKSFEVKTVKKAESTVGTSGTSASAEASASNKSGVAEASGDSASVTQSSTTTTGGSKEQTTDKTTYTAWSSVDDLQNRFGETFSDNNIGTVPWEILVSDCGVPNNGSFSKLYAESSTGKLPDQITKEYTDKLRSCQPPIGKLIEANVTIDGFRTDPNTGLWIATGNVNVNFIDLTNRGRSIGRANRTFTGRAEKQTDAARNALANSAKEAADVVVNMLNKK